MLSELLIQHFLYIDQLELDFKPGMTVVTGETGAGKSILLDALSFVLGGRLHKRALPEGAKRLLVQASFALQDHSALKELLDHYGLPEEPQLVLRRVMDKEGRTKAFINDVPVTIQLLKTLAEPLVTLHGQHGEMLLMRGQSHRELIDAYKPDVSLQETVKQHFLEWKAIEKRRQELLSKQDESSFELDYLKHVLEELANLKPEKGEETDLIAKRAALLQQTKYQEVWSEAHSKLKISDGAILSELYHLQRLFARMDMAEDSPIQKPLEEAIVQLEDVAEQCMIAESQAGEEGVLDTIEERLSSLQHMARKLRCHVDELSDRWGEIRQKCHDLDTKDETLAELEKASKLAKASYIEEAKRLSGHRKGSAEDVSQKVLKELAGLKLPHAQFSVKIDTLPEHHWAEHGTDQLIFHVAMNPGAPLAPLQEVASGGELSRFLLAIRVVLHHGTEPLVMVFDEADSGIGGATADAVGKRLALLGHRGQVLLITHHPQVAAWATHHILVAKEQHAGQGKTDMQVATLSEDARIDELARMLAGARLTDEARAAAKMLLQATKEMA